MWYQFTTLIMSEILTDKAIVLLQQLIASPSYSGSEQDTASLLEAWFMEQDIACHRHQNNVWAVNKHFDPAKKTLLLNSHHDTVKPNKGYTRDPFEPSLSEGKLYGLGSNDAGGCLVALLATFAHYYQREGLHYNLVMVASAEEENSGPKGLNSMLPLLPNIEVAIVGEPTSLQLAIAEKGLLVLDGKARGTAGHAAHGQGDNAIYKAAKDIQWFQQYRFPRISKALGEVKMTVTQLVAGHQHNVIPATCDFVVDIRVTDAYTNQEVLDTVRSHVSSEIVPRSTHLNPSSIPETHPLVQAGIELGCSTYGSPTLSDQAVLRCPSLKLGPGNSKRSHTADEFIYVDEIREGVALYINLLAAIL